ncbi:iojap-like protein [Alicyclobacillus hesperidum URH17-3-68]|uniref:Ribosomal silencing factor RsfS n=1 Tax=Alicyclobacillus hesperidum TaxID=89784 RepID=A0A1H2UBN1_9BACL|nr:ribosome silencing factor [Alicyclobacillus hesperidum]KRW91683.1 iojap [Alicyclobacillus tengchongensis]EJY57026.1 iojap-like protein [Alicyclobacillus hesperidum URH17-3-68]SDW53377.1 ribosome-associated protein [Alicyclobacillus hesperidum]GLG00329.1 ribosomal silencing factor RsfS [Alicyclobacillus hesperidum subsp. aegles]GLV14157.1 ribosomal silencing factor RsfS [Alicyclobacillus hesperidum]
MQQTIEQVARRAATAAQDKKATDVLVMNVQTLTPMADYFVICSASSRPQVEAVTRAIRDDLGELGVTCKGVEGLEEARWVLLDFGDVVVHVFRPEEREFYHIERLWGDAEVLPLETSNG